MRYAIKAHPTIYGGVTFRSRLEARWAAWFNLAGWEWEYEPIDLEGWSPDFRVEFLCCRSGCQPTHTLLVEVKPYFDLREFDGHPCRQYSSGCKYVGEDPAIVSCGPTTQIVDPDKFIFIPADASAAFGANPRVTYWEMSHEGSSGHCSVYSFVEGYGADDMWRVAGALTQYRRPA